MKYLTAISLATMMVLTIFVVTIQGTADEPTGLTRAGSAASKITIWEPTVAFVNTQTMDGVAVGDADPANPGNDIVTVGRDQGVYLTRYDNTTKQFSTDKIYDLGGQPLSPAIGNLKGDANNEIAVVGVSAGNEDEPAGNGTAVVLSRTGTTWTPEVAFEERMLIHGVDIGDLDPTIPEIRMHTENFIKLLNKKLMK